MAVQGNKAELAHAIGVSLPTLSRWLLKFGADFPVVERGTNGRDYVFNFDAVFTFLRTKREEESRVRAERDEQLAQLKLPFDIPIPDAPKAAVSPKDELDAWKLRRLQREEAERAGQLVPAEQARQVFTTTLTRLSRDTHAFLRQLGREQGWPDSYNRNVATRYAEVQRLSVSELDRQFGAAPDADEPDRLTA